MLIWNTFCECIKICTLLVMAQCLNFWLLVCFLRSQDWLWSNFTSIALLQGAYRRHFLASVHFHVDLIHFLWVHQDLHTPCHGTVFTFLTTCLLLARTRLAMKQLCKHSSTTRSRQKTLSKVNPDERFCNCGSSNYCELWVIGMKLRHKLLMFCYVPS